jgi:hypothetical protein
LENKELKRREKKKRNVILRQHNRLKLTIWDFKPELGSYSGLGTLISSPLNIFLMKSIRKCKNHNFNGGKTYQVVIETHSESEPGLDPGSDTAIGSSLNMF